MTTKREYVPNGNNADCPIEITVESTSPNFHAYATLRGDISSPVVHVERNVTIRGEAIVIATHRHNVYLPLPITIDSLDDAREFLKRIEFDAL